MDKLQKAKRTVKRLEKISTIIEAIIPTVALVLIILVLMQFYKTNDPLYLIVAILIGIEQRFDSFTIKVKHEKESNR